MNEDTIHMENCPKCNFKTQPTNIECPKCGLIFSKYKEKQSKKEISNDKSNSDKILLEDSSNENEKINLHEDYNLEEQSRKWSSYERKLDVSTFFIAIACGALTYLVLRGLSILVTPQPESIIALFTSDYSVILPAFFGGLCLAYLPYCWIMKKTLDSANYEEFIIYQNAKSKARFKVTHKTACKGVLAIFIPLTVLMSIALVNTYAVYSSNNITLNSFLELKERSFTYDDISTIKRIDSFKAPNGNIVRRPYHEIHFNNGFVWSFHKELAVPRDKPSQFDLVNFISKKSNKEIEVIDPYKYSDNNDPNM